jgi:phospholipase C
MSEAWETSVLQWAYDAWGGWYDHVPPPQVDAYGYGFRTAAQLASPYARRGYIDSEIHDFTSILRFIQDNWSIPSLSTRDAKAVSIATALDFSQPPRLAELVPMDREEITIVVPRRSGIYLTYSTAILFASAVIVLSFFVPAIGRRWGKRR